MTSPPVQSITVVLADQRMEPFRPDVTIEWIPGGLSALGRNQFRSELMFHAAVGDYFLEGWRKLVSLSTNVADSDYETPLEKGSAMSALRRKGASS